MLLLRWALFCWCGSFVVMPTVTARSDDSPGKLVAGSAAAAKAYNAARQAQAKGDYAAALKLWEAFLREFADDPTAPTARLSLALCQLQQGDFKAAIEGLTKLHLDGPAVVRDAATWNLAVAHQRRGEAKALPDDLQRAVDLFLALAERSESEVKRRTAARLAAGDVLLRLGELQEAAKQWTAAAATYRRLLDRAPDHPRSDAAALALADCLVHSQQTDAALKVLDQLARRQPSAHRDFALLRAAEVLAAAGRHHEALQRVDELLRAHQKSAYVDAARYAQGQALAALKRPSEAAAAFAQVRGGRRPDALLEAAQLHLRLSEPHTARKLLAELVDTPSLPQRPAALYLSAQAAWSLKQTDEAVACYRKLIAE
ncbi:MAG: tetratricopeptide repeat protein, partial [Gemmataceae bacterium]|nr:tetratricopeptide repeat protein [Gemmataceae bacterium]